MSILSSISRGLEFRSVNHTSIYENFESKLSKKNFFWMKYLIVDQMFY